MNRKIVLIFTCAMALALTGLQAMARNQANQPAPQSNAAEQDKDKDATQATIDPEAVAKAEARLQQLTTELSLSDEQKAQIKPILLDAARRIKAVKDDPHRSIDSKKSKMDEIHDGTRGQIRQFLSPDQSKKLDTLKENDEI
jgi:hypothetical protein